MGNMSILHHYILHCGSPLDIFQAARLQVLRVDIIVGLEKATDTLPNIRNTLNKNSTSHSGPRIAANSVK